LLPKNSELAPHIEDLKRALGEEISKEKIEEELKKYFEYGIEVNEAKKAVVKKLGGDLNLLFTGVARMLSEVLPTDKNINLKVKILSINDKTVTVQGIEKNIFYGLMADTSMIRTFTAWNDFNLSKNDVIHIHSAYAKDWRGEPQINLGNNTTIESLDDQELNALNGNNLPSSLPSIEHKIGNLKNGMSNITIIGRLLSIEPRIVKVLDEEKEIFTGKMADETGKIAYTAWTNFDLKTGDVVRITGAYVRSWRGVPKLNFDERMELDKISDHELPTIEELDKETISRIDYILEHGGAMDVTIDGTILEVKDGSGFIIRCPECNRVLHGSECMVHGNQEGVPDLRVKAIMDDGTGALLVVLNSDITSKLLKKTVKECALEVKEKGTDMINEIMTELTENLLMHPLRIKGTVTIDDYGAMMICSNIDELVISEEIQNRVKQLLDELNSNDSDSEVQ
jgi:replication factor A1